MKITAVGLVALLASVFAASTAGAKPLESTKIHVAVGKFNPKAKFDWVKINPQPLPPGGKARQVQ